MINRTTEPVIWPTRPRTFDLWDGMSITSPSQSVMRHAIYVCSVRIQPWFIHWTILKFFIYSKLCSELSKNSRGCIFIQVLLTFKSLKQIGWSYYNISPASWNSSTVFLYNVIVKLPLHCKNCFCFIFYLIYCILHLFIQIYYL